MDKPRKEHDPDKTRRWVEESNLTMPPEERIEVGSSEQKNGEENNIFYLK